MDSKRSPVVSEREQPKYAGTSANFQERLAHTTAFGQWANDVNDKDAQHGLFGTSAAVQILSRSAWTRAVLNGESHQDADIWITEYLRTVNFIDMVVTARTEGADQSVVTADLGVTLRACHAARAIAAAAHVLSVLHNNTKILEHIDPDVLNDLGDLSLVASRNSAAILEILINAKVRRDNVQGRTPYAPPGSSSSMNLYTFTSGHDPAENRALPDNINDWMFLQASVLVALTRCWAAQLVLGGLAEEIYPADCLAVFRRVLRTSPSELHGPDNQLDDRLRLFGLWALSHLDATTSAGPCHLMENGTQFKSPPHLTLEPDDHEFLRNQVEKVCTRLLASEINLSDSYSPYTFWIGPDESSYKDDSLVVPVVPLLLSLVARYAPEWLSRTQVLKLIEMCTDSEARAERRLTARPYQLSTQDGVVNLSYYHEACETIGIAVRTSLSKFPRRARAQLVSLGHDWGKWIVIG